ncbi:Peptidase C48, SUMO/Sentrin/Ubl1 [Carpediemonas membranifera]|uniref:Peptidase C48, SUMO/Sentrin/Ubl1 n=1 Tax=Carpediemonas membranifera TaxID=201153 RepID=A0A8J6E3T8_9EUKA|nr:Peptidase C48, SUMO/Sentrin/Ubl1 [Carpediemonas membranifera]|eukprot:KAG9396368.1 Peptidase C48, SUMO/Sentrin/Ubl1 [Carpediemonas membranifera]
MGKTKAGGKTARNTNKDPLYYPSLAKSFQKIPFSVDESSYQPPYRPYEEVFQDLEQRSLGSELKAINNEVEACCAKHSALTNDQSFRICRYPLHAKRSAVSLTKGDLARLKNGGELDDSLIEFYIKYLTLAILTEEERQSVHMFSTYFYTKLSHKSGTQFDYESVKRWAKSEDVFTKKLLIVPVHQAHHWSLLIVVRPGDVPPTKTDEEVKAEEAMRAEAEAEKARAQADEASATVFDLDGDDDEDTTQPLPDPVPVPEPDPAPEPVPVEETKPKGNARRGKPLKPKPAPLPEPPVEEVQEMTPLGRPKRVTKKPAAKKKEDVPGPMFGPWPEFQPVPGGRVAGDNSSQFGPCLLYLDSIGGNKTRAFPAMRQYLQEEWRMAKGDPRVDFMNLYSFPHFNVSTMPKQNNVTDCGLFVLLFIHYFINFECPDIDYGNVHHPLDIIKRRKDIQQAKWDLWFSPDVEPYWMRTVIAHAISKLTPEFLAETAGDMARIAAAAAEEVEAEDDDDVVLLEPEGGVTEQKPTKPTLKPGDDDEYVPVEVPVDEPSPRPGKRKAARGRGRGKRAQTVEVG